MLSVSLYLLCYRATVAMYICEGCVVRQHCGNEPDCRTCALPSRQRMHTGCTETEGEFQTELRVIWCCRADEQTSEGSHRRAE